MGVCFGSPAKAPASSTGGSGGDRGAAAAKRRRADAPGAQGAPELSVLFFPDDALPCHQHFRTLFPTTKGGGGGCRRGPNCKFAHTRTGLVVLLQTLYRARRTLDVCVYVRPRPPSARVRLSE